VTAASDPDPPPPATKPGGSDPCPRCGKRLALCVCAAIAPVETRHFVLILQHPQEQDRTLGTARIAALQLLRSRLVVGLSWPSLAAALGRPAEPRRWGVLYLGAVRAAPPAGRSLWAADANGEPLADREGALAALEGILLLDGSWSQAKALWWRNPWLRKLRRLVLAPPTASLYGKLRREPRREALSTIESAALALEALEGEAGLGERILAPFGRLIERYRAAGGERRTGAGTRGRREGVAKRGRRH
jgi:DTW domain-containing protein YfiP